MIALVRGVMAAAMRAEVGLERVIRLDQHHAAGVVLNVKLILGKEGNQDDDFVAGIEQRLEHHVDGARRSHAS